MGNKVSQPEVTTVHKSKEIFVQLLSNDITHKSVDVIIAFVDTSWNTNDEILQGLARIGGNIFVSEWNKIRNQKVNNCQVGDVFCVQSGALPCRHVLFAVWREGEAIETSDIHLNFVVENMLEKTKRLGDEVSTIAIPLACGMGMESHVKILNNVYLWLMASNPASITGIHFLTSNKAVEQIMETALQNFKEFAQQKREEDKQQEVEFVAADAEKVKVRPLGNDPSSSESVEHIEAATEDLTYPSTTDNNKSLKQVKLSREGGNFYQNVSMGPPYSQSTCDEVTFNTTVNASRISSESNQDRKLFKLNKTVDRFPEKESIWKYYTGSQEHFTSLIEKTKPKSVQFSEVTSEYAFETGRPVSSTLSQSSMDEVELDHINVEMKRKKVKRRSPPTTTRQSPETKTSLFFCSICQSGTELSAKRILSKCRHEFCSRCIDKHFEEVSPSCPNCKIYYGKPLGNQPDGLMWYSTVNQYLPGYPATDTIIIEYEIPDGTQTDKHPNPGVPFKGTHRIAYIPDNEHGRKIHRMLRKAFDQKLIFTVGKSATTGKENMVTWNDIHHKTRPDGGPQSFGYPDPEYLDRVEEQLTKAGITDEPEEKME